MQSSLKRILTSVTTVLAIITLPLFPPQAATRQTVDAEATIEALQTQVAEQEATIEALRDESTSEAEPAVSPPTDTESNAKSSTVLDIGGQIQTNVWSITIDQTETQNTIELYEVFTAQGVYLLDTLQLDNLTDLPLEFPYRELEVVDAEGRTYSYQDTITANLLNDRYDPLFEYSLLQPDLTYETVAVFELPEELTSLELTLNDGSGDRADEAEAAAEIARGQALPVGSTLEYDNWDISVQSTEVQESFTSIWGTHAPRGVFLVVYVTVTNIGNEPVAFPYEGARLVDATGRWFSFNQQPTDGMAVELTDQQYWEQLQPGIPYQTGIVFDIPDDATKLLLVASFAEPSLAVPVEKP